MLADQINEIVADIYQGNLNDKEVVIAELLMSILNNGVKDEFSFLNLVKIIESELKSKNFVLVCDLLLYEMEQFI